MYCGPDDILVAEPSEAELEKSFQGSPETEPEGEFEPWFFEVISLSGKPMLGGEAKVS